MNPQADNSQGNSNNRTVRVSLRIYRALANAFPREFKDAYGHDLVQVTEEVIDSIWRRDGLSGLVRLLIDIAIRLPAEYLAELRQDVHCGLRMLAGSPGFTLVALLSLSLGICIATCAFSEMNGLVLRTLPDVAKPHELLALQLPSSYPEYKRYRQQHDLFSSTMAYLAPVPFAVSLGGRTQRNWGHLVTPSYFSTLGVRPALGSFFNQDQEKPGQAPTAVVSYHFWEQQLGSDPSVIGKTLRINGQPVTVIGVGPKDFLGASPMLFLADLWLPLSVGDAVAPELKNNALEQPELKIFRVVGRLRPRTSISVAEAELDTITQQFQQENAQEGKNQKGRRVLLVEGGKLLPLRKQDIPFFSSFLLIMAGLVMLIACANVANMMLARAAGRRREIAVRLALGASRPRIVRQLLTESMMIALGAGALGFVISVWLMRLLSQLRMPVPIPVSYDFRPDTRVLLFTFALTLLTGLAFGLAPALQATRAEISPALKQGGDLRLSRFPRLSLRNALMISQMAGSLTLLVILGIMAFGIQTTMGIQAGLDRRNLYLISLDPVRDGYAGEQATQFLQKMLDRVKTLPFVTSAALTESVPVSVPDRTVRFSKPGEQSDISRLTDTAVRHVVGKDYFETTGIPILMGRSFRQDDEANEAATIIVSEEMVRRFWKAGDPIGRRIEIGDDEPIPAKILPGTIDYRRATSDRPRTFEVVGVARDVAEGLIVQKPRPAIYFPLHAADYAQPSLQGVTLMVRATPGVDAIAAVEREISTIDKSITPFNARSMSEHIEQFMAPLRAASWTYALIGVFGLILAAVGLAGMTAYSVTQRSREIGVRMALGARKSDVLRLIMKEGAVLVALGTIIGAAGASAGARLLSAMSSTVGRVNSASISDPIILIGAPLILAAFALAACYVPARKAVHVAPVVVLRHE